MQFEIIKNPGIDFYSGFRENAQGGAIGNPPKNVGIDFYSGFRKKKQGGVQFEILKKSRYRL